MTTTKAQIDQLMALNNKVTEEPLDERGRHFVDGNYSDLTQCHHGDTGEYRNREDGQAIALLWNLWKLGAFDGLSTPATADHILHWRCFHCDDVFHDKHAARMHFGSFEHSEPACKIKAGAEGSILEALRRAEADAEAATSAMHNESAEGWRAYHNLASRVREQVDAAENIGYERGLVDGRAEPAPVSREIE